MAGIKRWIGIFTAAALLTGCGSQPASGDSQNVEKSGGTEAANVQIGNAEAGSGAAPSQEAEGETVEFLKADSAITELEAGFSVVRFDGDDGFDTFLEQGGGESDRAVLRFLTGSLLNGAKGLSFETGAFGCSTISVKNVEGGYYFGRNFDWNNCDAMAVLSYPENGYASVSTVNMDFIRQGAGYADNFLSDELLAVAALYAPLDGMNEKGLCVSVNMIQDRDTISQDTRKPDITTTTAVRLLLNRAATADEAVELLAQYDFHASMDYMVHLAVSDSMGNSVAIEYVDNVMSVMESPVLTNFYLSEGDKNGIGTEQSHIRFEMLENALEETPSMDGLQVRDVLRRVSKGNFGEFESTEWSVVFDQTALTATYYHRENYERGYGLALFGQEK